MAKYKIIGNMTGNSMDAIDLVLTEFDGDKMTDICTYSKPYGKDMQEKVEALRAKVFNKSRAEIEKLPEFWSIHNEYICQIAACIKEMCEKNNINPAEIDAIGFHGKTLDHNPPSKAKKEGTHPYTLQIGSGQMLADLVNIPVVYDFRSEVLMAGFDGAPLVPPHNAHISATEGDGCYYNGGNTSNFAIIENGKATIGADAGPFNEYTDAYIRNHTSEMFDKDGMYGKQGSLNKELLQDLFNFGRKYYETPLPKSGDPAYYKKDEIFNYISGKNLPLTDVVRTFEYFAAYIAVQALTLLPKKIRFPEQIVLFGGGWHNPIVRADFKNLLNGKGFILPEHQNQFTELYKRLPTTIKIRHSGLGDYMEARLMADLARYKLENKAWELPETIKAGKSVICGQIAYPCKEHQTRYKDSINQAAKGWQKEVKAQN